MKTEDKLRMFDITEDLIIEALLKVVEVGREHQKLANLLGSLDIVQEQQGILDYKLRGPN